MRLGIVQPAFDWNYIHEWTHRSMLGLIIPWDRFIADTPRGGDIAEKREAMTEACLRAECNIVAYLDADMVISVFNGGDAAALCMDGVAATPVLASFEKPYDWETFWQLTCGKP